MENKPACSAAHITALLCVFTLANGVISLPDYGKSIIPLILALIAGTVLAALCFKPVKRLTEIKLRCPRAIVFTLAALALLFAAFLAAREYILFVYSDVLKQGNMLFISAVFCACVIYPALKQNGTLYKFSLVCAAFISVIFLVMFLISAKNFDIRNLKSAFDFKNISVKQTLIYFLKLFLPLAGALLFIAESSPVSSPRQIAAGVVYAVFLTLIITFDSVLSFGLPLASKLPYPYIDDISTVTVGSLFTRMDGFAYFAFFLCYVLKCSVLLRLAARLLCRGFKRSLKVAD